MAQPKVSFTYKNHRGETARRHVIVDAIEYIAAPGYNYEPGWFLSGKCLDKGQRRSFAFANITPDPNMRIHKLLMFTPTT